MKLIIEDELALVTGASRGIGRGIALTLGKSGCRVLGTATSEAGAVKIGETLKQAGIDGAGAILNVAEPASVRDFGEYLQQNGLRPTILVNNAGITRDNLLLRMKEDDWNAVIETDLGSIYRLCKLCLRHMLKQRHGRIINITSVVALSGNAGQTNYSAAKAGIIGFTRSLAREVGNRGITVNAVAPGFIATDMTEALSAEQRTGLLQQIALGRLGRVEEIADVVVFLASSSAAYITGATIHVNGGMYMA